MPQFSANDKAVILNDFEEKGWTPYRIAQEHGGKGWVESSVRRLLKKYQETGSTDRRPGSGRPKTATTEENEDDVEEMICSQEEPGTHVPPRKIAHQLEVSHTSVRRMIKNRGINQFKRLKTPSMKEGTKNRRLERAIMLATKFERHPRLIERAVFQDEKDFTLDVPLNPQNNRVYFKGKKSDVPVENLYHQTKRMTRKVMVSAALTWHGATKPFFVNDEGLKVNAINYHKHLKNELFPAISKTYPRNDWVFMQDGASSHTSNLVQSYLKDTLKTRFVKKTEWPPSSPDVNPLDFYFWNAVKEKVYEGRLNRPFQNEDELKQRIKEVWNECARNKKEIRSSMKQFVPRLRAIEEMDGNSIKTLFG